MTCPSGHLAPINPPGSFDWYPQWVAVAASLFAALALGRIAFGQVDQPRLRKDLANGVRTYAERRKGLNRFALCVAFEADSDTAGPFQARRHLLEHLAARGDGTVDRTLESKGCTLSASTTRDTLVLEISGPTAALNDAADAIRSLMQPLKVTPEDIAREASVLAEEQALRPWYGPLTDAAWTEAFAAAGAPLFEDKATLAKATPEEMAALWARTIVGKRTTIAVVADLDPEAMAGQAARAVGFLPKGESEPVARDSTVDVVAADGDGTARALVVPGYGFSSTVVAMATAFALQSRVPGVQAVFTPSSHTCLVTVAFRDAAVLAKAKAEAKDNRATLAIVGKTAVRSWSLNLATDPVAAAKTRALMLQTSASAGTELLVNQAADLSDEAFLSVLDKLFGDTGR